MDFFDGLGFPSGVAEDEQNACSVDSRGFVELCQRVGDRLGQVGAECGRGAGGKNHIMHGRSPQDRRPLCPHNVGMEHVGFSPTRQTSHAPSAKRREVLGESHEG